jgi:hypothetical protein
MLAGVLVDVDIGSSLSILLMTLMAGVDPAVALLAHFIGITCNIRFVRIGNGGPGMVSNTLIASIVCGNWWQFAVHGLLLSLAASRHSARSRQSGFAWMKLERKIDCDAASNNENRRYENRHAVTCLRVAFHFAVLRALRSRQMARRPGLKCGQIFKPFAISNVPKQGRPPSIFGQPL